jgi:hypothetical protein
MNRLGLAAGQNHSTEWVWPATVRISLTPKNGILVILLVTLLGVLYSVMHALSSCPCPQPLGIEP